MRSMRAASTLRPQRYSRHHVSRRIRASAGVRSFLLGIMCAETTKACDMMDYARYVTGRWLACGMRGRHSFEWAESYASLRIGLLLAIAVLGLLAWLSAPRPAQAETEFLDPAVAFVHTAAMPDPLTLDIHYRIAPEYYMYRERFEVRVQAADGRMLVFH